MKIAKKGFLAIIILFILGISSWFIYTRFCLPKYQMEGNSLKYKNEIYIMRDTWSITDQENIGRTIGIGVMGKRAFTDLIWPFWVMEYKNDKGHDSLYVRGLMDSGGRYDKIPK